MSPSFLRRLWLSRPRLFNNPVIKREVVERLRKRNSFILLFLFLACMSIFVLTHWYNREESIFYDAYNGNYIRSLFFLFCFLQALFVLAILPFLSATRINIEFERESWELLLTTNLNAASIVWAKLLSALAYIALMVVALIPFYGVFFILGNVAPQDIYLAYWLMLESLVLTGLIGLCCSARISKPVQAITAAFFCTIVYLFVPPILSLFFSEVWYKGPFLYGLLLILSPLYPIFVYANGAPPNSLVSPFLVPYQYTIHIALNLALYVFLFRLCLWFIRRKSQAKTPGKKMARIQALGFRRYFKKKSTDSIAILEVPDGGNPVYWKENKLNENWRRLGNYCSTSVLFVLSLFTAYQIPNTYAYPIEYIIPWEGFIYFIVILLPAFVIPYAVNTVRGEKDRDTWEILSTTLLGPAEVIRGKVSGGMRLFTWRFLAFYGLIFIIATILYIDLEDPLAFLFAFSYIQNDHSYNKGNHFGLAIALLVLGYVWGFFYNSLGIYFSTLCRNTTTAYVLAAVLVSCILFLPPVLMEMINELTNLNLYQVKKLAEFSIIGSPLLLIAHYFETAGSGNYRYTVLHWMRYAFFQSLWMITVSNVFLFLARKRIEAQD